MHILGQVMYSSNIQRRGKPLIIQIIDQGGQLTIDLHNSYQEIVMENTFTCIARFQGLLYVIIFILCIFIQGQ